MDKEHIRQTVNAVRHSLEAYIEYDQPLPFAFVVEAYCGILRVSDILEGRPYPAAKPEYSARDLDEAVAQCLGCPVDDLEERFS